MPDQPTASHLIDESDADHYFNATRRLTAKLAAAKAVCAERERELLELKGPCGTCPLHYAHSGPCAPIGGTVRVSDDALRSGLAAAAPHIAAHETNRSLVANRNARDFHEALAQVVMERDWLLAEATDDVRARYHAARRADLAARPGTAAPTPAE